MYLEIYEHRPAWHDFLATPTHNGSIFRSNYCACQLGDYRDEGIYFEQWEGHLLIYEEFSNQ